jgi:GMP synthase (glutamine-hydrolysing)
MKEARRLVLIRHGDDPPDDRVATYAALNGFVLDVRRPFKGDELGVLDESVAGTVLYGGPFSVYDTDAHSFLADEHRWIEACMDADLPVLGICQGAQSIAHVLGARVGEPENGLSEFGYYEVSPTPDGKDFLLAPLYVTQSHFHEFATPVGAVNLASSEDFANQAFRYGTCTYGLQFHPEITIEGFRRWQNAPWARYHLPGAQDRDEQTRLMYQHDETQGRWFYEFLEKLFGVPAKRGW